MCYHVASQLYEQEVACRKRVKQMVAGGEQEDWVPPCLPEPGIDTQSRCAAAIAAVLPAGSVAFSEALEQNWQINGRKSKYVAQAVPRVAVSGRLHNKCARLMMDGKQKSVCQVCLRATELLQTPPARVKTSSASVVMCAPFCLPWSWSAACDKQASAL